MVNVLCTSQVAAGWLDDLHGTSWVLTESPSMNRLEQACGTAGCARAPRPRPQGARGGQGVSAVLRRATAFVCRSIRVCLRRRDATPPRDRWSIGCQAELLLRSGVLEQSKLPHLKHSAYAYSTPNAKWKWTPETAECHTRRMQILCANYAYYANAQTQAPLGVTLGALKSGDFNGAEGPVRPSDG
eukprot:scaffold153_cov105-Isochrysis_galbana.AAC.1